MTKTKRISICLLLVAALCFAQAAPLLRDVEPVAFAAAAAPAQETEPDVQNEGVVRPEELDEGLSLKSLEDIRGRRVTVRQPIMEVTGRHDRTPAQTMDDTFAFIDPTTGEPYSTEDANYAINFADVTQTGNPSEEIYPREGLTKQAGKYFSDFTKYMLLRQVWYYNKHAMELAADGKLKKHPAADGIYGAIPNDAQAVVKHIVTDPIYRSPMTTGLYLVAGEAATLTVRGLAKGERLTLYTHHQDSLAYQGGYDNSAVPSELSAIDKYFYYWDSKVLAEAARGSAADYSQFDFSLQGQWSAQNQKVPCMGATFTVEGNGDEEITVKIGSIYGGPLYVQPTDTAVDMVIDGAVETPHFILGVTTVEEFERDLRDAPGRIATLDVENGQLIGPAKDMAACDDIEKLAYFWHSVFAINISLNGREYNYNITMKYDLHVPAGEAVALGSDTCAQPVYWFPTCMNYAKLTTSGNWGTFHELGHVQAKAYGVNWGFGEGEGEVWNNTLIILMYSMLCNMDNRLTRLDDHGEFAHPYTAIQRSLSITKVKKDNVTPITDYSQINEGRGEYFDQLSLYSTLIHSFGPERFVDMFYTYKLNSAYCKSKRADFVYRIALVDKVNILKWVNGNYFANIERSDFSSAQLAYLDTLPDFYPVAFRYSNGIDGHETARRHEVDGKHPTSFDLTGDNIACYGNAEIVRVTQPKHGSIAYTSYDNVVYTPPVNVTEYDSFDIVVRTDGGRTVTLNVNLRLLYNGSYTEVWTLPSSLGSSPSVDAALSYIDGKDPTYTECSGNSYLSFTHNGVMEYFHTQYVFRADKAGEYKFYLHADDASRVIFHKNDLQGEVLHTLSTSRYSPSYTSNGEYAVTLNKGDRLYLDCHLVNWGGQGNIFVGVIAPDEEKIVDLPSANMLSAFVSEEEIATADGFEGWQPQFADSIKNASIDCKANKASWQVLSAPTDNGDSVKENIVDGSETTYYHNRWQGEGIPQYPHEFVIDTGSEQLFNYFEIATRNGNPANIIQQVALYGATVNDEDSYKQLYAGDSPSPNSYRLRLSFEDTSLRYFKLVVIKTSKVTCIAEVYAGLQSQISQPVKPSSYQTDSSGFEENDANGKLSAKEAGAYYDFEFIGDGFDVFADTGVGYGSATVSVDNEEKGIFSLDGEAYFNKCVYKSGEMAMGQHTVRIATTDGKPFNISFINVSYGTPVDKDDYPALQNDDGSENYGDTSEPRRFSPEWRTLVKDYKQLTSISLVTDVPEGYKDTYLRMDEYIRLYRDEQDPTRLAFVYPGVILAPSECGMLFSGCSALEEIALENFDTTQMLGVVSMFNGCSSLKRLALKKFDTSNTRWFGTMFANCTSLSSVDISAFSLENGASVSRMFDGCDALEQIVMPANIGSVGGELPAVYRDAKTGIYTHTISSANAGHTLNLHAVHKQGAEHAQVEPTCTQTGKLAYYNCAECGFACIDGEYRSEDSLVIPALGHEGVPFMNEEPTCSHPGRDFGVMCDRCGEVMYGGDVLPPLPHTEEVVAGRPATETESGLTDGLRCSVCGEVLKAQEEIPALGSTQPVQPSQTSQPEAGGEQGAQKGLSPVALAFIALGVAVVASAAITAVIIVIKKHR